METDILPLQGRTASLDEIFKMQDIIFACGEPEEMPLRHFFSPGLYLREITMRADLLVVGKMHATTHFNIITKGDVTVLTDNGPLRITITDHPYIFVSQAGTKKVLYCHEDTVWMTTHITDSTDLAEIERQVIIPEESLRDESGKILLDDDSLKALLGDKL